MTWSLNEIEALSRKAAKGAGYSWGLAEEAGRAVRWLEARNQPGAEALAAHLRAVDGRNLVELSPDAENWTATGTICPILAGTMLADGIAGTERDRINLNNLAYPLLILPFLSWMAEAQGIAIGIEIAGAQVVLCPDGTLYAAGPVAFDTSASVTILVNVRTKGQEVPAGLRSACSAETVSALGAFAHRTYAPATEESRLAGAGAGLTDND